MSGDTGFNAWVGTIADYLSLISPIISIMALIGINKVRRDLTTRSLLPNIVETLTDINSNIAQCVAEFPRNEEAFSNEITKCKASLRPLVPSKNDAGSDARKILKLIENYEQTKHWYNFVIKPKIPNNDEKKRKARKIYEEINGLIEEIKRLMLEQRIGG